MSHTTTRRFKRGSKRAVQSRAQLLRREMDGIRVFLGRIKTMDAIHGSEWVARMRAYYEGRERDIRGQLKSLGR